MEGQWHLGNPGPWMTRLEPLCPPWHWYRTQTETSVLNDCMGVSLLQQLSLVLALAAHIQQLSLDPNNPGSESLKPCDFTVPEPRVQESPATSLKWDHKNTDRKKPINTQENILLLRTGYSYQSGPGGLWEAGRGRECLHMELWGDSCKGRDIKSKVGFGSSAKGFRQFRSRKKRPRAEVGECQTLRRDAEETVHSSKRQLHRSQYFGAYIQHGKS